MSFDIKEFDKLGYTRPKVANQNYGGRGGGLWNACILGSLEKALKDETLLRLLASELKPGDEIWLGGYATQIDFRAEKVAETARVLIVDVRKPEARDKPDSGEVRFHELSYFDLAKAQALMAAKKVAGKKATAA